MCKQNLNFRIKSGQYEKETDENLMSALGFDDKNKLAQKEESLCELKSWQFSLIIKNST